MTDIPSDIFASHSQPKGHDGKILILTADGVEDTEFFYPYYRFMEEGYRVDVITPNGKSFKGKNGSGLEETMRFSDVLIDNYDLMYIPGGKAPEKLMKHDELVSFVSEFHATGKPIAAICHGPQLLAAAEIIEGRGIAAWPECEKEIAEAGGVYKNHEVVKDGPFITSRWPADLPAFMATVFQRMEKYQSEANREAA
jgi:protease I